jgi:ABC-type nitrate/sulfonate/bicarbonate transport system permease component
MTPQSPRRLGWLNLRGGALLVLVIDLILLTVIWHVAAVEAESDFLPTPGAVAERLSIELQFEDLNDLPDNHLIEQTVVSFRRVIVSVGIAVALAAPLALLAMQAPLLDRLLTPLLYFLFPAPKVVFLPLIILFLGFGDEARIFLITLVIFFQVFVIVHDAGSQVPPETLESIRSLGAGRWHLIRYVYIPVSVPAVITALKISTGTAIAVLFIAETIVGRTGLGYYIKDADQTFAYEKMYVGVLVLSLMGLALFSVFWLAEQYLTRWQKKT